MKFNQKQILHLSRLARIRLTSKEKVQYQKELGRISDFASIVQKVKDKAEPLYTLSQEEAILREDKIKKSLDRQEILRNAPDTQDSQFKVNSPINE